MKKLLLLTTIFLAITIASFAQTWTSLATDGTGDGAQGGPNYLDGTKLEYRYDGASDSIWFRVTVANVFTANYGINIIMNVNGGGSTAAWFGTNSSFMYNRIITVWITSGSSGTVGVTDAAGFAAQNYTKLGNNNIDVMIDAPNSAYILGMKRTDIYNDTSLDAQVIAGVGSNMFWDDDVPNSGSGTIMVQPTVNVSTVAAVEAGFHIYPNPAKSVLYINSKSAVRDAMSIRIYNTSGAVVYSASMQNEYEQVDVSALNSGVYFLQIVSDTHNAVQQIILK